MRIVLLLWTSSYIVTNRPKLANPRVFTNSQLGAQIVDYLSPSSRLIGTGRRSSSSSLILGWEPFEVGRDTFPLYTGETRNLHPEGMSLSTHYYYYYYYF